MNKIIASDDIHTVYLSVNNEIKFCKKGEINIPLNHYTNSLYIEDEYLDNLYIETKINDTIYYVVYKDDFQCVLVSPYSYLILKPNVNMTFDYTEYNFLNL